MDNVAAMIVKVFVFMAALCLCMADEVDKWPESVVPYTISGGLIGKIVANIKKAVEEFNRFTCVKFIQRTTEKN